MRYFVIAFAVGALACFGQTFDTTPYPMYRIQNTPEGAACARQCKIVENTCLAAAGENDNGRERRCDIELHKCRATCPGAERAN